VVKNGAMDNPTPWRELDLPTWPRRATFEYFRAFDKPYFNVCVRIDVAALKPALATLGFGSVSLACHFIALKLANQIEPFRYRLHDGRVRVLDAVHASTTVLREDDSFGFAYLRHADRFADFAEPAAAALRAARAGLDGFAPRVDDPALIHCTTLPWLHFTSFSHARNWGREDAVPKLAFGRIDAEGARRWMPLSVEVHHALMDGVHVGRYVQAFEEALRDPLPGLRA
jgi:chloramphenicol O-acetyltransferase type A